jgi:ABC-type multidrug transport system ATPase subunit
LPQEFGLPPHLTCLEYLRYVSAMKQLPAGEADAQPYALLQRFGLEEAAGQRIGALSGGMRQRLGLAQALLGRPRLIILDEPSAGLDPQERVRLRGIIRELAAEATILLSTHIVSDIEREASRVGILHKGHLVAEGSPEELIAKARGKVFEVRLDPGTWQRVSPDWMRRDRDLGEWPGVVASVATPEGEPDRVVVRVISPAAPAMPAHEVEPTLEDAYLLATSWPHAEARLA